MYYKYVLKNVWKDYLLNLSYYQMVAVSVHNLSLMFRPFFPLTNGLLTRAHSMRGTLLHMDTYSVCNYNTQKQSSL